MITKEELLKSIETYSLNLNQINEWINNGYSINQVISQNGDTLLLSVILYDIPIDIDELLKLGADPFISDFYGNTTLHNAIITRNLKSFEKLLKVHNIQKLFNHQNKEGETILHNFCSDIFDNDKDFYHLIKKIINKGGNLNLLNNFNETPLECCEYYDFDKIKFILKFKPDLSLIDKNNKTVKDKLLNKEIILDDEKKEYLVNQYHKLIKNQL